MAEKFDKDKIQRIESYEGLNRIYSLINKKEIARRIETTDYQTFMSRIKNHTKMDQTVKQKACAAESTELLSEMFYEIGVALGYFKNDPHKKYKYVDVNDPAERAEDEIGKVT